MKPVNKRARTVTNPNIALPPGDIEEDLWLRSSALSHSISAIAFIAKNGRILYVNPAFLSIWGYSRLEEVKNKPARLFYHLDGPKGKFLRKLREKGGWIGQLTGMRKSGETFPAQMTATMLSNRAGSPQCTVASFLDISERISAEQEQNRLMRQLRERVKELGCLYKILSLPRPATIPEFLRQVAEAIRDSLQWPAAAYARIQLGRLDIRAGKVISTRARSKLPIPGENGFVEIGYNAAATPAGKTTLLPEERDLLAAVALEIARELSRMKAEEKLQDNREILLRSDKMASIGVLSAGIIHEISNPNNYIAINTAMLMKAWVNILPVLNRYFEENGNFSLAGLPFTDARTEIPKLLVGIGQGSDRIKEISAKLRSFLVGPKLPPAEVFQVNAAIETAIEFTRHLISRSTGIFEVKLVSELPEIRGDARQFQQVVINLLTNACQALTSREQGIRLIARPAHKPGHIEIIISDQGRGISAGDLPHIMDPFFSTKRGQGGTGLGLSISRDIVTRMGGSLLLRSKPQKGTSATITLPIADSGKGLHR